MKLILPWTTVFTSSMREINFCFNIKFLSSRLTSIWYKFTKICNLYHVIIIPSSNLDHSNPYRYR